MLDASTQSSRVKSSARILIRRVVRILKACGISDSELREIFGQEISTSASMVQSHVSSATARQIITCSDVVLKWRRDSKFLTSEGLPGLLSLRGVSSNFSELVHSVSPSDDPSELLMTLKELGVVRMTESESIELISESVVACSGREGSVIASEPVLEHICGFLGSVEYNLFDKPSRARGRFERACYASVSDKLVPVLENLVSSRGQDFVDIIDEWLARRAIRPTNGAETVLVGAGAYVFIRENVS
jgi:hypothetical protein